MGDSSKMRTDTADVLQKLTLPLHAKLDVTGVSVRFPARAADLSHMVEYLNLPLQASAVHRNLFVKRTGLDDLLLYRLLSYLRASNSGTKSSLNLMGLLLKGLTNRIGQATCFARPFGTRKRLLVQLVLSVCNRQVSDTSDLRLGAALVTDQRSIFQNIVADITDLAYAGFIFHRAGPVSTGNI